MSLAFLTDRNVCRACLSNSESDGLSGVLAEVQLLEGVLVVFVAIGEVGLGELVLVVLVVISWVLVRRSRTLRR